MGMDRTKGMDNYFSSFWKLLMFPFPCFEADILHSKLRPFIDFQKHFECKSHVITMYRGGK